MSERRIYGTWKIADYLGVSESAVRRVRKTPAGEFIQIGSMSNDCGGFGLGAWSVPSSLDAFWHRHRAEVSDARRAAANKRWKGTDVTSGSVIKA